MSDKAKVLLTAYKDLDWDTYIGLCDLLTPIHKDTIGNDLAFQASIYSHYSGLLALSKLEEDKADSKLKRAESLVISQSEAKLTAKRLDAMVLTSPNVIEAQEEYFKACYRTELLHSLVKALDQKKDCLIQMSSNQRAEINLYAKG